MGTYILKLSSIEEIIQNSNHNDSKEHCFFMNHIMNLRFADVNMNIKEGVCLMDKKS